MTRFSFFIIVFVIVLSNAAHCGEVLLSENFETLDLKKIPSGAISGKDISIIASTPDRGKVLRIKNTANAVSTVSINLDINTVRRHQIRASVLVQFPGTFQPIPSKSYARPKLLITYKGKD